MFSRESPSSLDFEKITQASMEYPGMRNNWASVTPYRVWLTPPITPTPMLVNALPSTESQVSRASPPRCRWVGEWARTRGRAPEGPPEARPEGTGRALHSFIAFQKQEWGTYLQRFYSLYSRKIYSSF